MTVVNRYWMPVVGVGTVYLLMSIKIPNPERKVFKGVVLNDILHARECKQSLISVPYLTKRGLKVKFVQFGAVITEQCSVKGTAKRVDQMYVFDQCDYYSVHVETTSNIYL